jgi:polyribonucleotide nucleotidyltransferase
MAEAIEVTGPVGAEDKVMTLETGKLAGLANGAVVVTMGRTKVLVTATANKSVRPGTDFFPLTVDFEERSYAAGKIPGSFFRREGRAGENAILACRLTDRPLRPLFPEGFRNDVHIVATVIGADMENPYDVMSINAASAALSISGIPFSGPLGCVRIAFDQDGEWIVHPT